MLRVTITLIRYAAVAFVTMLFSADAAATTCAKIIATPLL